MSGSKKKIFFLLFSMNLGGVEKSFLYFIKATRFINSELHLGLLNIKGEYLDKLPPNVIIHECCKGLWPEINMSYAAIIKKNIRDKKPIKFFKNLFGFLKYKLINDRIGFYITLLGKEPEIDIVFDEAYAFAGPSTVIDFYIVHKVKALQKFGYIHYDVSKFFIEDETIKKLYKKYNKIYIVSKEAKTVFDNKFPKFSDKTELKLTPINYKEIRKLSEEGESYYDKFDGIRILTVGRVSYEKGPDMAIEALKILLDKGFKLRWYFIGDGIFLEECRRIAKELDVEDKVWFLGKRLNPYPFMKDCDIYVQPSRHEGFCLTLAEAIYFNKPIVSTNFSGAFEQLKNTSNYIITDGKPSEMAKGIMKILNRNDFSYNSCI